jgi:hypothetical protein
MKTITTILLVLTLVTAVAQDEPKRIQGMAYIPTLYIDATNYDAMYKLKSQIEAQLLPFGAAVKMLQLADATMPDIREWQLKENKKWMERVKRD